MWLLFSSQYQYSYDKIVNAFQLFHKYDKEVLKGPKNDGQAVGTQGRNSSCVA